MDCNQLAVDIDNEIAIVHNFMRDKYRLKFPELESLVHHPIDYARVVKAIGNEMDITLINLDDILPQVCVCQLWRSPSEMGHLPPQPTFTNMLVRGMSASCGTPSPHTHTDMRERTHARTHTFARALSSRTHARAVNRTPVELIRQRPFV